MKFIYYPLLIVFSGIILFSCKSSQTSTNSSSTGQLSTPGQDNSGVFIDANKQKTLGNYTEAIKLFNKALEINPNDGASMYELARLYTILGNSEMALSYAEKSVKVEPENQYYLLFYAGLLQSGEDFESAAKIYEKLVLLKPNSQEYYNRLAVAYLYAGEPMESIRVYDELESITGINEKSSLKKQSIYLQEKKVNKAVEELEKLISAFPLETKYYAILAEVCMANGMEDKALEAYNKILELNADDPYIHITLADYYKKNSDFDRAFEELKLGFKNPNLDIDSKIQILIQYYTLNEIYTDLKQEAFELAEILIEVHPDDPKSYSIHGDFLYQDEQFEEARDAFRMVISIDSSKYLVWEQLLFTESELQDNTSLLHESKRAIELFPEQPIPYLFAGGSLYEKKEWEECISVLERGAYFVVSNDRLLAQFYAYLGDAYYQVEEIEKSDASYDRVLMINPDHDYVLNNYAYYLSIRGENLEKAAKMAKRATELKPDSPSNQDTYGWVLYKMEYYEDARIWIQKALDNESEDSPVMLEHMGDILWKLGEKENAIEYWQKAKAAGKGSEFLDKKVADQTIYE